MKKWYSLIDKVYRMANLRESYRSVRVNNGAPGIDGVTVQAYGLRLDENLQELHRELEAGRYQPQPVRRIEIPKTNGGTRPLGIPTVRDRVVQQALLNVLGPIFDPGFHPSSYGYRPNRSAQQAVAKAERFMNRYGLSYVVDMDLSQCFDRLDHDLILKSVGRRVSDGSVLRLIQQFLTAGVMQDGAYSNTTIGSPQGGVISPLLANIYLDAFDQRMMQEGIRIVRYADDTLVFAQTRREAGRYSQIARRILEDDLRLRVNEEKTQITSVYKGVSYLGFIIRTRYVRVHPKAMKTLKDKMRRATPRNHGMSVGEMVKRLNRILRGWVNYFRIANCTGLLKDLMHLIRRRLRMKKMREWKSWKGLHKELRRRGYTGEFEKISMRRWRNSASPLVHMALPNQWFQALGLIDLTRWETGILSHYYER